MEKKVFLLVLFCLTSIFILNLVSAYTNVTSCTDLDVENEEYKLNQSISTTGTCFTIDADSIVLDCQGYTITYDTIGGYGIDNSRGYDNITIKNCKISQTTSGWWEYFHWAPIYFVGSENGTIINNTIITKREKTPGIYLYDGSNHNNILNNTMNPSGNYAYDNYGINIYESTNNTLKNNKINNSCGSQALMIWGSTREHFNHSIDMTNLAEGLPIIYNFSLSAMELYKNQNLTDICGQLICGACEKVIYENVTMGKDGINLFNSSNCIVERSRVVTSTGHGIRFESHSHYNLITNNTIVTSDLFGKGISLVRYSNYNNVTHNNISVHVAHADGVYLRDYSNLNLIENNEIATHAFSTYGIFIRGVSNLNIVKGNNVTTGSNLAIAGDNSNGISIYNSSDAVIINNNFTTHQQFSTPLHISLSESITMINNTCNATNAYGLYIEPTNDFSYYDHTIENNTINGKPIYYYFHKKLMTIENDDNIGEIYIAYSDNITIKNMTFDKNGIIFALTTNSIMVNNTINISIPETEWCTYCNYYEGAITLHHSSDLTVDKNTIMTAGKTLYSIYSRWTSNSTIKNNNINNSGPRGYGIYLRDSSYSFDIFNNVISTSRDNSYGMYINAISNTIRGNSIKTINDTGAYAIYFRNADINEVYDNVINATNVNDIYVRDSGTINLTNCTFNQSDVSFYADSTAQLNIRWYMDVFVDFKDLTSEGAIVNAYDVNNNLYFSEETDPQGYLTRQNVTEYYENATQKYYFTNYSVNATRSGDASQTEYVNLTTNFIDENRIVLKIRG